MKKSKRIDLLFSYLYSAILFVIFAGPFIWMFITSISSQVELTAVPLHWFPENPTFKNYVDLITGNSTNMVIRGFMASVRNSIVISVLTTAICLFLGSLAAYAFSRINFKGKQPMLLAVLLIQLLPTIAIIIPLYLLINSAGLMDTQLGLIIVYSSFTLPYAIWAMKGYFDTIPFSLEESAAIDGCTRLGILWHIVLPLAKPGLIATAIFSILNNWSEFLLAVVFTSTAATKTIPVLISEFQGKYAIDYSLVAAGGVLASIPPIIFAFLTAKQLIGGIAAGSIKG